MKKYLLILLGAAACSANAAIHFQAEPPAAPAKLPLLQLVPVPMSRLTLMNRAYDFGLKEGRFRRTPRGILMESGNHLLSMDPLGGEFFADTSRFMAEVPGEADPLPDQTAKALAEEFFRKRPGRVKFENISIDRILHLKNQGQDLLKGELSPVTQDESIVLVGRLLNGIRMVPLDGTGEHVRLHFDNNGVLTGQHLLWRNVKGPAETVDIMPYEDVKASFLRRLTSEMGNSQNDAYITKIEFGYFSRPEGQPQGWFQPAYLFFVQFFDVEMKQTNAARILAMPALKPDVMPEPLELPSPPSEMGDPGQVTFKVEPPQLPGSLPVYPVTPNLVTEDGMLSRGRLLGLTQGKIGTTPRGLSLFDGRLLLAQDPAGSELFSDTERMLNEPPGKDPAPGDAIVIERANKWLSEMGLNKGDLGSPVIRRLMQQTSEMGGKPGEPTADESIVEFPRLLHTATGGPLPTVGEGAFARVHVDNLLNVTGHHLMWRNVGPPEKTSELRPYTRIQEDFLRRLTSELGQSLANVVGIQVGPYFRPEGTAQGFAQPAVLFEVDIIDRETGDVTAHRQIPIPAAMDPVEPLDDPDALLVPNNPEDETSREADAIPVRFGDVNGDGSVNVFDVADVLKAAGGVIGNLPPASVAAGDVTPAGSVDGRLTLTDALRILRSIYSLDDISSGP